MGQNEKEKHKQLLKLLNDLSIAYGMVDEAQKAASKALSELTEFIRDEMGEW